MGWMLVKPADDFCMKNASTLQATPQAWVQHEARRWAFLPAAAGECFRPPPNPSSPRHGRKPGRAKRRAIPLPISSNAGWRIDLAHVSAASLALTKWSPDEAPKGRAADQGRTARAVRAGHGRIHQAHRQTADQARPAMRQMRRIEPCDGRAGDGAASLQVQNLRPA